MTTMIECTEAHYEVQKTSYGKDYVWCPEHVVVECNCGERLVLTASETLCWCGADNAALVREQLASKRSPGQVSHPWDAEFHEWRKKQDEFLVSEETYRLELNAID